MTQRVLNRILLAIIAALLLVLAGGMIAVFAGKKLPAKTTAGVPAAETESAPAAPRIPAAPRTARLPARAEETRMWAGLARVRCPLKPAKGKEGAPVAVLSITFSYNRADQAWTYELARNNTRFQAETRALFATLERNAPLLADETALKQKLLERYNAPLRLGKIGALIFSDYVLID